MKEFLRRLIPARWRFYVVGLVQQVTKCKQVHYSQNGEDIVVPSYFPRGYRGFYVDVGAHHPYRLSNTYTLYKRGWRGINIDPNPDSVALFKRARPGDINLCVGVDKTADELTYYRFSDPAVNTFSKATAEKLHTKSWLTALPNKTVSVRPLRDIFAEQLESGQTIDFLNVDVEGLDLEVLQSNDWQQYKPKIVAVEVHNFVIEKMTSDPVWQYLHGHGYQLVGVLKFTLIFKLK